MVRRHSALPDRPGMLHFIMRKFPGDARMRPKRSRMKKLVAAGLAAVCLFLSDRPAAAFPEPNVVTTSWQLEFKHEHPRAMQVRLPGEQDPRTYWYMVYTVTNNSGEEQNFVPVITLLSDAGDFVSAQKGIPPVVFTTLKQRLRNPLLTNPTQVVGRILQGADNAIDGVAIWSMPDHDVNHVSIFFEGLSGETHVIKDPRTGDDKLLRKTLHLQYDTPGSVERQPEKPWIFNDLRWVVR